MLHIFIFSFLTWIRLLYSKHICLPSGPAVEFCILKLLRIWNVVREKFSDAWKNINAQSSDSLLQLNLYCFKIKHVDQKENPSAF